jgi:hypothetical protein
MNEKIVARLVGSYAAGVFQDILNEVLNEVKGSFIDVKYARDDGYYSALVIYKEYKTT